MKIACYSRCLCWYSFVEGGAERGTARLLNLALRTRNALLHFSANFGRSWPMRSVIAKPRQSGKDKGSGAIVCFTFMGLREVMGAGDSSTGPGLCYISCSGFLLPSGFVFCWPILSTEHPKSVTFAALFSTPTTSRHHTLSSPEDIPHSFVHRPSISPSYALLQADL